MMNSVEANRYIILIIITQDEKRPFKHYNIMYTTKQHF